MTVMQQTSPPKIGIGPEHMPPPPSSIAGPGADAGVWSLTGAVNTSVDGLGTDERSAPVSGTLVLVVESAGWGTAAVAGPARLTQSRAAAPIANVLNGLISDLFLGTERLLRRPVRDGHRERREEDDTMRVAGDLRVSWRRGDHLGAVTIVHRVRRSGAGEISRESGDFGLAIGNTTRGGGVLPIGGERTQWRTKENGHGRTRRQR